jgi:hypothetical protein
LDVFVARGALLTQSRHFTSIRRLELCIIAEWQENSSQDGHPALRGL